MIKEVKYSGITANSSDYESKDGELTIANNLINEDGALKPVRQPKELLKFNTGTGKILFLHKTATFAHYIVIDGSNHLFWYDAGNTASPVYSPVGVPEFTQENYYAENTVVFHNGRYYKFDEPHTAGTAWSYPDVTDVTDNMLIPIHDNSLGIVLPPILTLDVISITAVGNTLNIVSATGLYRLLWRDNNSYYLGLGYGLPECKLSLGLKCEIKFSDSFVVDTTGFPITDEDKNRVTNAVMAQVNKLIADEATDRNRFCMPFFVRYALRLFDGSLTMQSAPVLMLPTNGAPLVYRLSVDSGNPNLGTFRAYISASSLDMKVTLSPRLLLFSDIVKSVDIFVSAPIYTYDQSGICHQLNSINDTSFGYFALDGIDTTYSGQSFLPSLKKYTRWATRKAIQAVTGVDDTHYRVYLPEKDIKETISDCSNFYLLKSIPINELSGYSSRKTIEIPDGYIKSLLTRETLPDDYDSHDSLSPQCAFNYNSRLILANINKNLFNGYFNLPFTETNLSLVFGGDYNLVTGVTDYQARCLSVDTIFTTINRDGKTVVVKEQPSLTIPVVTSDSAQSNLFVPYFYHPDPHAETADIYMTGKDASDNDVIHHISLSLKTHSMLNGSFIFSEFIPQTSDVVSTIPDMESSDRSVAQPNKIYTSEVSNPFLFPVTGIVTVGTGSIIGISTAARALSQGQFGQFPLYAFTDEGIWALEVSTTGTFSARQPISRDVCNNASSITQTDTAVLFSTDRGLMLISGSETSCISDILDTDTAFYLSSLPHLSDITTFSAIRSPFSVFLSGASMLYDYVHQRIIVFNPAYDSQQQSYIYNYAYVFSYKSRMWGMMDTTLLSPVNAYPECLAMTHNSQLVSFTNPSANFPVQLLISRPLKFDDGNILKSVNTLIQRGLFQQGDVKTVLYGSRDLYSWHLIGSSTSHKLRHFCGSPYKYFRLVAIASLSAGKSLSGISVDFTPRHTNNLY